MKKKIHQLLIFFRKFKKIFLYVKNVIKKIFNLNIILHTHVIKNLEEAIELHQIKQNLKNEICPKFKKKNINSITFNFFSKNFNNKFKKNGENENFYNHNIEIPMNLELKNKIENNNNQNKNYKYELTGFIKHFGEAHSGHNIAICKNFFDDNWYIFDDSNVHLIKNSNNNINNNEYQILDNNINIDTSNSFLYFYKRNDILKENY